MRINPCHGCRLREGCDLREGFRRRARGVGARSISFNCPRLAEALRPGRRITVMSPAMDPDGNPWGGYDGWSWEETPATITASDRAGRFACVIDRGKLPTGEEKHRFRRMARAGRIVAFLDEPDRRFCPLGSLLDEEGKCDTHPDWGECPCREWQDVEGGADD